LEISIRQDPGDSNPKVTLLPYERRLLRAVAHQLGTVIEKKRAEERLTQAVQLLELRNWELERKTIALQELVQISSGLGESPTKERGALTTREHEIARGIRDGKSTKDLADQLGLSETTIEKHRYNIRRKLGLTKAGQNLQSFLRRGMFGI
jgi:DNA-binding NarL/FixJ family response regulator